MSFDAHMNPFLPKDLSYTSRNTVGEHCDVDGNYTDSAKNRCREARSKTTGLTYLVRRSEKDGDRIFILRNGAREPYAQFGQGKDIYRIVRLSPMAEQYASAHGYRLDQQDHTMVAMNAPPVQAQPTIDCKAKVTIENLGQRGSCTNGGTRTATAPSQAPQVAQAPTCTGNAIQRNRRTSVAM